MQHDLYVVINFVVEEELDWFCKHLSDSNVRLKYVVLKADKEKIIEHNSKTTRRNGRRNHNKFSFQRVS